MSLDDALLLAGQVLADYEASGLDGAAGPERIWAGRLAHALRDVSAAAACHAAELAAVSRQLHDAVAGLQAERARLDHAAAALAARRPGGGGVRVVLARVTGRVRQPAPAEAWRRSQAPAQRARYAELLASARASVAAAARGDADPVVWVRGVLGDHGQLPEPGASPARVVADARSAMRLTGWPS